MQFLLVLIVGVTSIIVIQATFTIYEGILGAESAKVLNLSTISIENELKQVERFSANIIANSELQKSLAKLKTKLTYSERSLEADKVTDDLRAITFEQWEMVDMGIVSSSDCSSESTRADEIGELQSDFKLMFQKIDTLIKENYTKQLTIKSTCAGRNMRKLI